MIPIDGESLKIEDIFKVAYQKEKVRLTSDARKRINNSYQRISQIIKHDRPVYGINTGFGIFANKAISIEDSKQLNRNLILSHSVGTGEWLPIEVVRAAMLIRTNALAKGYSGVKIEIIDTLIEMLNKDVIPAVKDKGSLGSSGDLCMLAQLALVLSCDEKNLISDSGMAFKDGKIISGYDAMNAAGIERQVLMYKDGLALINGATFSTAILALTLFDCKYLCDLADAAAALCLEGLLGKKDAFHPLIHYARGIEGQITASNNIRKLVEGSSMVDSHEHIQDGYSIRCAPQVHGAVREMCKNVESIVGKEINAATDNPLIVDDGMVISGGNFHGEAVGIYADALSIAISELSAISERRIFRLLDSNLNYGLPSMLVDEESRAGLNSGAMMMQYTAAALVLENQTLSSPDSVRSLPTSANQEDHNANAYIAAFHTHQILENAFKVLTIELLCACRAIDLRVKMNPSIRLGLGTQSVYNLIRSIIPYKAEDCIWGDDIETLNQRLRNETIFKNIFYKDQFDTWRI